MTHVNDDGVGIGLIIIGLIFLVFGMTLIFAAYKRNDPIRLQYPRWHHKRFMAYCFEFWLGISLIMAVAIIDAFLGLVILRTNDDVAIGWVIYFAVAVVATLASGKHWARDNLPEVLN